MPKNSGVPHAHRDLGDFAARIAAFHASSYDERARAIGILTYRAEKTTLTVLSGTVTAGITLLAVFATLASTLNITQTQLYSSNSSRLSEGVDAETAAKFAQVVTNTIADQLDRDFHFVLVAGLCILVAYVGVVIAQNVISHEQEIASTWLALYANNNLRSNSDDDVGGSPLA